MGLPYLGYSLGYLLAKILKQPAPDCLAIAIETGIQNTGIAIFLLRFTLPQPQADLTTGNNPILKDRKENFVFSCPRVCSYDDATASFNNVYL